MAEKNRESKAKHNFATIFKNSIRHFEGTFNTDLALAELDKHIIIKRREMTKKLGIQEVELSFIEKKLREQWGDTQKDLLAQYVEFCLREKIRETLNDFVNQLPIIVDDENEAMYQATGYNFLLGFPTDTMYMLEQLEAFKDNV